MMNNYGIDKISSLPDDVHTHILSFLTTKEVVKTCILSKRWINTWASVPDLKFDIEEFGLPEFVDDEMAVEFVTKFKLLLRSVLEKPETSCVNKFQLLFDSVSLPWTRDITDCIDDVMKLNPRECLVNLNSSKNLNLNANLIFNCASLIHLQLSFFSTRVDLELNSVNLPCLKTLSLHGVATSDNFLKKLLLGCPCLEELELQSSRFNIIEICSNILKKLVLRNCYGMRIPFCNGMIIQISTPNVLYLDIHAFCRWNILLLNLPSLVHASICFHGWYDQDEYVTSGPKLIQSLSNVKSLLFYPMGKVWKMDFSNCPVFDNLKSLVLVLVECDFCVFDFVPFFIHQSPKLQEVTLENYIKYESESESESDTEFVDEEITQEGPEDALVQREFLETVRIVGFKNINKFVDQLINKLLLHVKIIGEIDII